MAEVEDWETIRRTMKQADILFAAQVTKIELESEIDGWRGASHDAGPPPTAKEMVEGIRWDYCDRSLEIDGANPDFRLLKEQVEALHAKGFAIVFVNHRDGWESIYHPPIAIPHRRPLPLKHPHHPAPDHRGP